MSSAPMRLKLTAFELAGRVEWRNYSLEAARLEGRVISAAERTIMDRYVDGEITGDEARLEMLRLFETPGVS
jgi:hypothetical protein